MSFVSASHWSPEPGLKVVTLPHKELTWQSSSRAHLGSHIGSSSAQLPCQHWDLHLTFLPQVTHLLYSPDFSLTLSWRWTIQNLAGNCCKTCSSWSSITLNKNIYYKMSTTSTSISQIFFSQDGFHVLWPEITAMAFSLMSSFWVPSSATTTWNERHPKHASAALCSLKHIHIVKAFQNMF